MNLEAEYWGGRKSGKHGEKPLKKRKHQQTTQLTHDTKFGNQIWLVFMRGDALAALATCASQERIPPIFNPGFAQMSYDRNKSMTP